MLGFVHLGTQFPHFAVSQVKPSLDRIPETMVDSRIEDKDQMGLGIIPFGYLRFHVLDINHVEAPGLAISRRKLLGLNSSI